MTTATLTTSTLDGKPYAGNPHVRFDEGEVASAKPRRGSLLYNKSLISVVSALSVALLASSAWADANVNLTADVRAKHAAGECGEPTTDGSGHANYPYTKAFDGISDSDPSSRWLSVSDYRQDSAWAQYVAPEDYASGATFALTSYRVHRLFSGQYDSLRAPTKWEILGVLPDGTTEVIETREYTWGTADTDAVRIQTFALVTNFKYRGFRFHSLETIVNGMDVKFGLLEVEFFVSWVEEGESSLTVFSSFADATGFSPEIGTTVTTDTTCTAPTEVVRDYLPRELLGYTLEKLENGVWTGGDVTNAANTYVYSPKETKGAHRLTWCYDTVTSAYNLVPTMRAASIEPMIEGPNAGADYPVDNIFDGVTHSDAPDGDAGKKLRWLCGKSSAYAKVSVTTDYHGSFAIRPVAYRVWRLYDGNQGWERSPTAWTLSGIRAEDGEEVTIDTVSGFSWTKGKTDDVRMKMIALENVPEGDFRSFVFTPTATQEKNDYTGLFELEIFVREVSKVANSLSIASAGSRLLDCWPAVGSDQTEPCTCTRTSKGYLGTTRYAAAGYKLYRQDGSTWTEIASDPTADTYEWDGTGGTLKLEWQWGEVDGYKVDVTSYGGETFEFSPALDARGFADATPVSITPIGQTDPASRFKAWSGDVPSGSETTAPLVLTVDGHKVIHCDFTRAWKFIPETDEATAGTFTDGNWSFKAETDTFAPIGDYEPDLMFPAAAYLGGQGLLDMSTLAADTGRRLTFVQANAVTNRVGLTGLILPPGLARIGKYAFSGSPDLTFVEMPDSVLQCDSGDDHAGDGGAFGACTALTRVKLSNALVSLGHQTFGECANLATVTPFLPKTLTYLGSAFQGCLALTGTPDLSGVETLEYGSFRDCVGIVGDLDLTGKTILSADKGPFMGTGITSARGVGALPSKIFYLCASLTNVSCVAGITGICERAFAGCTALKSVSAADGFGKATMIGYGAFSGCAANLTIPQRWPSVQMLDESAFWSVVLNPEVKMKFPSVRTMMTHCFIGAAVTAIDFRGSTFKDVPVQVFNSIVGDKKIGNIGEVILPETVTTLGEKSFYCWTGRRDIRFCGPPPTTIAKDTFSGCDEYKELYIHVPQEPEKLAAWKQDANFTALADIADVETKPGWDAIKDNKRLIGTWRNKWCFTWNASQKRGLIISVQ